jgi:uncharacterized membrane protein
MKNVNTQMEESLGVNDRIATFITGIVGSMWCAYAFALLALVSLPYAIQQGTAALISWIAQTFLQLVLLSVIMVGQNLQQRHSELRANNDYEVNVKAEGEIAEVLNSLKEIKSLVTPNGSNPPQE